MGILKKDKKDKNNAVNEAFRKYDTQTNEVKEVKKRADEKVDAKKVRIAAIKKEQLLEKMADLRKAMYPIEGFDVHISTLEDCIQKLKRIKENENLDAMSSVDNFILRTITETLNCCSRGNYVATGACLRLLDELISDRQYCGSYYTDPDFIEYKLERNQKYIEQQNQQSKYDNLVKQLDKLLLDYKNPALAYSRDSIAREANRVKAEGERIQRLLGNLDSRIDFLDKSIAEIVESNINTGTGFDMAEKIDSSVERRMENERQQEIVDKGNAKMDTSTKKVSTPSLVVNDDTSVSNSSENLSDDFFKMKR